MASHIASSIPVRAEKVKPQGQGLVGGETTTTTKKYGSDGARLKVGLGWVHTYDRSSGVAGVDPLRLCAKVAPPPSCLVAGFCMAPELIGPTPPKAQPDPVFTGIAAGQHQHHSKTYMRTQHSMGGPLSPYPIFRLVTCLLPFFLYVALVGLLQNRRASLLGTGEQLLTEIAPVSQGSFDRPETASPESRGQRAARIACRNGLEWGLVS